MILANLLILCSLIMPTIFSRVRILSDGFLLKLEYHLSIEIVEIRSTMNDPFTM